MQKVIVSLLFAMLLGGCGAHQMSPVAPQGAGTLKPNIEDADGGMVGMHPNFGAKSYSAIILTPFKINSREAQDEEDARLAKDMSAYLQAQLVRKLKAAGIFAKVIDASASAEMPSNEKVLRLEGDLSEITQGNRAARYLVGFGAGAAKAQIETRLLDAQSGRIELITADRRAAAFGIFGGNGRQYVTESMDQMADGYVRLLKHLAAGGHPGAR